MALISALVERVTSGCGHSVAIVGEGGIGKSRLVRELTTLAAEAGATVFVGRAAEGTVAPLRPIQEALLACARAGICPVGPEVEPFRPFLASLVPDWMLPGKPGGEVAPLFLAEELVRLLSASSQAYLLVFEDVHWADSETLAVVEYLFDAASAGSFGLVVTARRTGREAMQVIGDCSRRGVMDVIEPSRLDHFEVEDLVRSRLATADPAPALVDIVLERSEGVPFLVEELTADASAVDPATVPRTVQAAVVARMATLHEPAARLVRQAAVLGRALDWSVAAGAAGIGSTEVDGALRAAAAAELIEREGDGFRFRHALTRDAVLADLGRSSAASRPAALWGCCCRGRPPGASGYWRLNCRSSRVSRTSPSTCSRGTRRRRSPGVTWHELTL